MWISANTAPARACDWAAASAELERADGIELVTITESDREIGGTILEFASGHHLGGVPHSLAWSQLADNGRR